MADSRTGTKQKPPATSIDELVGQFKHSAKGAPSYANTLKDIRRARLPDLAASEALALADAIAKVDPSWAVRLHLLFESAGRDRTAIASALSPHFITQARMETGYSDSERSSLADLAKRAIKSESPIPLGAWIAALWPKVGDEDYPQIALEILRRLAEYDWSLSREGPSELIQRQRYVAALVVAGFEPHQVLRGALVIAKGQAAIVARASANEKAAVESADVLREINARMAGDKRGLEEDNTRLRARVEELEGLRGALEKEIEELRAIAEHDAARAATAGRTEASRMKSRVLDVLERERDEIARYLDRGDPNVEGALSRLVHLERLSKWLRSEA